VVFFLRFFFFDPVPSSSPGLSLAYFLVSFLPFYSGELRWMNLFFQLDPDVRTGSQSFLFYLLLTPPPRCPFLLFPHCSIVLHGLFLPVPGGLFSLSHLWFSGIHCLRSWCILVPRFFLRQGCLTYPTCSLLQLNQRHRSATTTARLPRRFRMNSPVPWGTPSRVWRLFSVHPVVTTPIRVLLTCTSPISQRDPPPPSAFRQLQTAFSFPCTHHCFQSPWPGICLT